MKFEALEGLPGVCVIANVILMHGKRDITEYAMADHDCKLKQLMLRCSEKNLELNKVKLKLRLEEVKYMGHVLTKESLKGPRKVEGNQ